MIPTLPQLERAALAQVPALGDRAALARLIVERGAIKGTEQEEAYRVASSTGRGGYRVDVRQQTCGCPDYGHGAPLWRGKPLCKHLLAAFFVERQAMGVLVRPHPPCQGCGATTRRQGGPRFTGEHPDLTYCAGCARPIYHPPGSTLTPLAAEMIAAATYLEAQKEITMTTITTTPPATILAADLASAYTALHLATAEAFTAAETQYLAAANLATNRTAILLNHADDPKALGANEAARSAKIDELSTDERAELFQADQALRRARHGAELARMKVEGLRAQLRCLEVLVITDPRH